MTASGDIKLTASSHRACHRSPLSLSTRCRCRRLPLSPRELAVAAVVAAAVAACRCRRAVVVAFVAVVRRSELAVAAVAAVACRCRRAVVVAFVAVVPPQRARCRRCRCRRRCRVIVVARCLGGRGLAGVCWPDLVRLDVPVHSRSMLPPSLSPSLSLLSPLSLSPLSPLSPPGVAAVAVAAAAAARVAAVAALAAVAAPSTLLRPHRSRRAFAACCHARTHGHASSAGPPIRRSHVGAGRALVRAIPHACRSCLLDPRGLFPHGGCSSSTARGTRHLHHRRRLASSMERTKNTITSKNLGRRQLDDFQAAVR